MNIYHRSTKYLTALFAVCLFMNYATAVSQDVVRSERNISRAVTYSDENNFTLQGSAEIPGDTLFAKVVDKTSGETKAFKVSLKQISSISAKWKYVQKLSSTSIFLENDDSVGASIIRMTATPKSLEITLENNSTFEIDLESLKPKKLFLYTKISQHQVKIELPLEEFTEKLASDDDKRRFALKQPIPTDKKRWKTTFASLDFTTRSTTYK